MAGYPEFPQTHWSLIYRAGEGDADAAARALSELLCEYQPVLREYLIARRRLSEADAEDLVQAFVADKVIAERLVEQANEARGRFRSFLLTALENYRTSELRRSMAQKRRPEGGVAALDPSQGLAAEAVGATDLFDIAWARQLIRRCIDRFELECERGGDMAYWTLFESRVLRPAMTNEKPIGYGALVGCLGFESPRVAANALITAKRRFARLIREEVARYACDEEELDEEVQRLFEVLAKGRAG